MINMGARLNFSMETSMSVFETGIKDRFLSWFKRQIPLPEPYGAGPNPRILNSDSETPFDWHSTESYRVGDFIVGIARSGYPNTIWIHVYPNVPMQDAWKTIPEFLKNLGVTYVDDAQEWYLRKVIGFCDEMIALQGSRR